MDFDHLSRRNFLKKTTVLAVGAANLSMFSGLVTANSIYADEYCHANDAD